MSETIHNEIDRYAKRYPARIIDHLGQVDGRTKAAIRRGFRWFADDMHSLVRNEAGNHDNSTERK